MNGGNNITELLARWNEGDVAARDALIPLVYDELRRLARRKLARLGGEQTLQATALVHEAYLRLASRKPGHWHDRTHFFALAAQMMRQILVDQARMRNAAKRGGGILTVPLNDEAGAAQTLNLDLISLDAALNRLAEIDPRQSRLVELRFFAGLSIDEAAEMIAISPATAKREWATARVWLHHAIENGAGA